MAVGHQGKGRFDPLHDWDVTPARARQIQAELRERVVTANAFGEVRQVAGVDVGYERDGSW